MKSADPAVQVYEQGSSVQMVVRHTIRFIVFTAFAAVGIWASSDAIEGSEDVFDLNSTNWNATFSDKSRPCIVEFFASWSVLDAWAAWEVVA